MPPTAALGAIDVINKIYLDSCIAIYLVERHPHFFLPLHLRIAAQVDALFSVSALTRLEVLARPLRERDHALAARYESFLRTHEIIAIDDRVVDAALQWRVAGLKTPDALHVALAQSHGCTGLWTNDDRLARVLPGWSENVLTGIAHP
ncbi:PIN domain-containing protein [uncultured Thiodictyon sp.]|uniref:type II toxin-antitoxin system VapC family toxin n=1 Tax=uncultured Thiodictyon sp. TaxID=1846217 RepID=UPI0025E52F1B|nr:PIN domain-containing protein [uncultured Thiodictyon sp.]